MKTLLLLCSFPQIFYGMSFHTACQQGDFSGVKNVSGANLNNANHCNAKWIDIPGLDKELAEYTQQLVTSGKK